MAMVLVGMVVVVTVDEDGDDCNGGHSRHSHMVKFIVVVVVSLPKTSALSLARLLMSLRTRHGTEITWHHESSSIGVPAPPDFFCLFVGGSAGSSFSSSSSSSSFSGSPSGTTACTKWHNHPLGKNRLAPEKQKTIPTQTGNSKNATSPVSGYLRERNGCKVRPLQRLLTRGQERTFTG